MPVRPRIVVIAGAMLALWAPLAEANPVVELGSFIPTALNGRQMIGGGIVDPSNDAAPPKPGLWANGTLTTLKLPAGATEGEVSGVNSSGKISGAIKIGSEFHAVSWASNTADRVQIGPFGAPSDFGTTGGVTDAGVVVGRSLNENSASTAFVANGGDIDVSSDLSSGLFAVTPSGSAMLNRRLVGEPPVSGWYLGPGLGSPGPKLDLTPVLHASLLLGGSITDLYAPNLASDGTLLGYKDSPRTYWLRLPNGSQTQVTGLVGHNAVNARHVVAGTISVDSGSGPPIPHAAIRQPDGTVIDLNTLLPASQNLLLVSALLINDNGDVAGIAVKPSGDQVGFLMPAGYIVDSTGDQADASAGDGNCLTTVATCTLRAAIQEVRAGSTDDPVSVSFKLPANATTIAPSSPLPAITKPIAIDGAGNPGGRVVLDGAGAGSGAVGLRIEGDNSRVRTLAIKNFGGPGIRVQASKALIGGLPAGATSCASPCNAIFDNGGAGVEIAGAESTGNAVRGNRLQDNGGPAIDLGGDGRTANDAVDADAGPNELHNFPTGVLGSTVTASGARKVAGLAAPTDAGKQVDVYAQTTVVPARGAEPADYVGSAVIEPSGAWAVTVPADIPATERFFSAAISTTIDGTSELSAICGDPDGDGTPDTDGDGLCDDWEIDGLDIDDDGNVDLPLNSPTYGADPSHKDLYLEVDAMTASGQRTYAPQQGAIDAVVKAFAEAPVGNPDNRLGVSLHVNPGRPTVDDTVDEQLTMNGYGRSPESLLRIREGNLSNPCDGSFGASEDRAAPDCAARLAARAAAFRYALFGYAYSEQPGSSGLAVVIGGSTMTVTVAQWRTASIIAGGGGISACFTLDGCRRRVDASTLMHEFGHLVGLRHGGTEDLNQKPNYLSVMNYLYQFQDAAKTRPLDYARYELPALDEANLFDVNGVLGGVDAVTKAEIAGWWPQISWHSPFEGCGQVVAPVGGPADWDPTPGTPANSLMVHGDRENCVGNTQTLSGPKDWTSLQYSFREAEGTPSSGNALPEPELSSAVILDRAASSDRDRNGVNDLADSCRIVAGSGFADANANGFADVCEEDMTQLKAFPTQAGGAGGGAAPGPSSGPAKDTTPPTISGLKAKPSTARRAKGKRKAVPAKLAFSVSEAAVITFTGESAKAGRLAGKRCVAGGKKGKKCTAYKPVKGNLRVNAAGGAGSTTFSAKLGTTKLAAGTYRLTAVAIDAAGNRSAPQTVTVSVR